MSTGNPTVPDAGTPTGAGPRRARRVSAIAAALVACAAVIAGCGRTPVPAPTFGPGDTASIEAPITGSPTLLDSPVTGVLLVIDSGGLADVRGFTLRTADGDELVFEIGTLENGVSFPPGHLAEHLASSSPIRVFFRVDGDRLVVYRIEDADAG